MQSMLAALHPPVRFRLPMVVVVGLLLLVSPAATLDLQADIQGSSAPTDDEEIRDGETLLTAPPHRSSDRKPVTLSADRYPLRPSQTKTIAPDTAVIPIRVPLTRRTPLHC